MHDAVQAGLYAGEDDVIRDALTRLRQTMPKAKTSSKKTRRAKPDPGRSLSRRRNWISTLSIGLLTQLPDTDADFDDPDDEPITIKGEPLSETIIRERC